MASIAVARGLLTARRMLDAYLLYVGDPPVVAAAATRGRTRDHP